MERLYEPQTTGMIDRSLEFPFVAIDRGGSGAAPAHSIAQYISGTDGNLDLAPDITDRMVVRGVRSGGDSGRGIAITAALFPTGEYNGDQTSQQQKRNSTGMFQSGMFHTDKFLTCEI